MKVTQNGLRQTYRLQIAVAGDHFVLNIVSFSKKKTRTGVKRQIRWDEMIKADEKQVLIFVTLTAINRWSITTCGTCELHT